MSALVFAGKIPSRKPHPAMKWTLLVALVVVVVLGLPLSATATAPNVQAPTGPSSNGVFTGPYSFQTYIYCSSGVTINSSYTGNLDGTHTYSFRGAPDGSLLMSVDGGGNQLLTSCGDPFATPWVTVATYETNKNTAAPSPTPVSPTPTPVPQTPLPVTPIPVTSPPTSGGLTTKNAQPITTPLSPSPTPSTNPTSSPTPDAAGAPVASNTPQPTPIVAGGGGESRPSTSHATVLKWSAAVGGWSLLLLLILGFIVLYLRSSKTRSFIASTFLSIRIRLRPYWFRIKMRIKYQTKVHARDLPRRRGLSAHHHTGKVLAHHHTSYPALGFLLLISTILLGAYSQSSHAADSQLTLTVLGPPPATAPTIDDPIQGEHLSVATTTARGRCIAGLVVELYRNGSFAGSTSCTGGGVYNLLITLTNGQNDLTARNVDALSQSSADSATVSVFYDPPLPTPTPAPTPSANPSSTPVATTTPRPQSPTPRPTIITGTSLTIDSKQHYYQGVQPGSSIDLGLIVRGGKTPYNLSIDWGDGQKTQTVNTSGLVNLQHQYDRSGIDRLVVRATDAAKHEAVMTLVVVINGQTAAVSATTGLRSEGGGILLIAWPIFGLLGLVLISFWLGEHHREATAEGFPSTETV